MDTPVNPKPLATPAKPGLLASLRERLDVLRVLVVGDREEPAKLALGIIDQHRK